MAIPERNSPAVAIVNGMNKTAKCLAPEFRGVRSPMPIVGLKEIDVPIWYRSEMKEIREHRFEERCEGV